MKARPDLRVANLPSKPVMLFDGDCHFCRRWIERWREATGDRVDYVTSQSGGARFPEIPREDFARAVQLIETDGAVYSGAAAVFQSLGYKPGGSWIAWSAERVPGFASASEVAYKLIARNRTAASLVTRLLWGNDVRRPTYFATRQIFLRSLGVIFLVAFVSLWVQVDGLIGSNGISPVARYLPAAHSALGSRAVSVLPTLCWLNPSDAFLHFLCASGVLFSLALIAGIIPAFSLFVVYACYLSLTVAGQMFLSFQWDILLLETGFLAIFFAPWSWRLTSDTPVSRVGLFLLKLLLFKLMFMSGVVKLTSGDSSWADLTATNYHYETQPLPTIFGWWAYQGAEWVKRASTVFTFVVELAVPFLIWMPRRFRVVACVLFIALQLGIGLTGNYAFFNLLTIVLSLLLLDDRIWRCRRKPSPNKSWPRTRLTNYGAFAVLIVLLPLNAFLIYSAFKPAAEWPRAFQAIYERVEPFRIANGYGLFRVMTKTRPEIIVEGSADGIDWVAYKFKWKPGDLDRAPGWVQPHQPRLDWQMWFAALGDPRSEQWFFGFVQGLLTNSKSVTGLLEANPFPTKPPRFIRAILYDYRFTSPAERRATGIWWKRTEKREYLPSVSLRDE